MKWGETQLVLPAFWGTWDGSGCILQSVTWPSVQAWGLEAWLLVQVLRL